MKQNLRIPRRTFLRGCGAMVALPMLDLMQPVTSRASESNRPPRRAAFFYVPNGVVQETWHVSGTGEQFEWSRTLKPLQDLREKISLFSNLDRIKVAGTDGHAQASTCWLSSAAPEELSPAGYPLKRTVDQLLADQTASHTPFRSLELSCNPYRDNRESVYFDNISWYGHGHVAQSMRDPLDVFQRLFRVNEQDASASILDLVLEDARSLEKKLGSQDRRKLGQYMESVRGVEKQIRRIKERKGTIQDLKLEAPTVPWPELTRHEYVQLMGDLMVLSLQTDLTRVASLMVAPERWGTPLLVHGLFDKPIVHHSMTHQQGDQGVRNSLSDLDRYHVEQFATLARKMDAIQEGEGTLLDNCMFMFGSGLSSGKDHVYTNLPLVIAGSAGGAIRTNYHFQSAPGTPVANLWLALTRMMGSTASRLGDSTEALKLS
ncbi:MAG: DUF1552 domain-containing protein [Planctomycetaceae bacterium]|nr:DUF1552 domain-containing protein [Planctomycetaceae bacterium]